jgi:hypothetical protein
MLYDMQHPGMEAVLSQLRRLADIGSDPLVLTLDAKAVARVALLAIRTISDSQVKPP